MLQDVANEITALSRMDFSGANELTNFDILYTS